MALSAEFETMALSLRSQLLTYSNWLSSPDPQVKSSLRSLVVSTVGHARWNSRKEETIKSLAEIQLTAMAHSESLLASRSNRAFSSKSSGKSSIGSEEGQAERMQGMESTLQATSSLYEHDVETRRGNLINRFDFIARSALGNSVYTQIIAPEIAPEDLFIADPGASSGSGNLGENDADGSGDGNSARNGARGVILTDPKAILQLTLASSCSLMDVQIDARGKYVQVAYDYDKPCRYVSRWVMEALERGKVNILEDLISKAYDQRCRRHSELSESLKRQFSEAIKAKAAIAAAEEAGKEKKVILRIGGSKATASVVNASSNSANASKSQAVASAMAKYTRQWAIEGGSAPEVDNIHARLLSAERDLVVLARVESLKYGVQSLKKGMGWMTMTPRGPVVTILVNPLVFGACLDSFSSTGPSDLSLSTISRDHLEDLQSLPSMDAASLLEEIPNLPSFNSNIAAPLILSRISPSLAWCSQHLGPLESLQSTSRTSHTTKTTMSHPFNSSGAKSTISSDSSLAPHHSLDIIAFHIEIEQTVVYDPNHSSSSHTAGLSHHPEERAHDPHAPQHAPSAQHPQHNQHIHSQANIHKRVGAAPRSISSAILSTPDPQVFSSQTLPSDAGLFVGVSDAISTKEEFSSVLKNFLPNHHSSPASSSPFQEPSTFCDLGIQWAPFEHADTPEDIYLPLSLVMVLNTEIPILASLFHRLRSIAAHPEPASLLNEYYQIDEAHRLGKEPPSKTHSVKSSAPSSGPKKFTLRTAKATAASSASSLHSQSSHQLIPNFMGASLASLYAGRHELPETAAPIIEDVVMPLSLYASSYNLPMARCLHSHQAKSSPACLMFKSLPFVDSRQIRPLVAILRQQAVITSLYASCFNPNISTPFSTYLMGPPKLMVPSTGENTHLRHSSTIAGLATPLKSSSNSMINTNFDLASPPRRMKRNRPDMDIRSPGPEQPHHNDGNASHSLNKSASSADHGGLSKESELVSRCYLTIELTPLAEPLFGWLVMVKYTRPSSTTDIGAGNSSLKSSTGATPSAAKKPKNDVSHDLVLGAAQTAPLIFSFAVHVSVDGYVHVQNEDCELVLTESRNLTKLQKLIEATLSLPVALQVWLKDI